MSVCALEKFNVPGNITTLIDQLNCLFILSIN